MEILDKSLDAIVATLNSDGSIQQTPVWFYFDGSAMYFSTTNDRMKYKNIVKNPQISIVVNDMDAHGYISFSGKAEILPNDEKILSALLDKYMPGQKEDGMKMFQAPNRILVKLVPSKKLA